jgi:2'-5' RNA ligase
MSARAGESDDSKARLFFAVLPDPATRERIAAATAALQLSSASRPVPRANYHMTLAFVGDVAERQLPILLEIGAAQRITACSPRFDAYEYWPKPGIIVAAARTLPGALDRWSQQLRRDLAEHRWALDSQQFRPHVTLARKVSQAPVLQAMSSFDWLVNDFCLVRSDTSGVQPAYTVVGTWPLLYDSGKA